jgi:hypothetical protein
MKNINVEKNQFELKELNDALHVQGEVWAMERKKHVKRDRKKKEIKRED